MPMLLTAEQIEQYRQLGCIAPIRVISAEQAAELRARLEKFERNSGGPLQGVQRHKSHLLFSWLNDLIREQRILDAVEDLYGGDLLCWTTNFFIKEANDPAFVSWHQDSTYWGLSKPESLTAWVALSASTADSGAMQVIPGTHLLDQIPHTDKPSRDNLLIRGQEVDVAVDSRKAVTLELQPGEMSLHHVRLIHGSPPNNSPARRIGFAIRYLPTSVYQLRGKDSATLVRGRDVFCRFEHEPRPACDFDPQFVALHRSITEQAAGLLLEGSGIKSFA
jgi:non-haem Fe2+, alpha-ketoglutarate-dependent halogenase